MEIIKRGRPIEEYADRNRPQLRNKDLDLKRVTSYFFFDYSGRYVQLTSDLKSIKQFSLDMGNKNRTISKPINLEQHAFNQLIERKISVASVLCCIHNGKSITQYCMGRKGVLFKNVSYVYEDLRVAVSYFDNEVRIKTAYRMTDINDSNLMRKLKTKSANTELYDYAIVDLDCLYSSPILSSLGNYCNKQKNALSKNQHYSAGWELLGNSLGYYNSCLSSDGLVRLFDVNKQIIDKSIIVSSLEGYEEKIFNQKDYDPKKEYGIVFFYENEKAVEQIKQIYGIGLSASIDYIAEKTDKITKKTIKMIGSSLTSCCGNEWIKDSTRNNLIRVA